MAVDIVLLVEHGAEDTDQFFGKIFVDVATDGRQSLRIHVVDGFAHQIQTRSPHTGHQCFLEHFTKDWQETLQQVPLELRVRQRFFLDVLDCLVCKNKTLAILLFTEFMSERQSQYI